MCCICWSNVLGEVWEKKYWNQLFQEQQKQHYEENKTKILKKQQQYHEENKTNIRKKNKQHYEEKKTEILKPHKKYQTSPE